MSRRNLGLVLGLGVLLVTGSVVAHPGHFGLIDPPRALQATRRPLKAKDAKDLTKRIEGSWKITGYRLWNQKHYMEVPVHKEKIDETMETFLFRPNGQFRHMMSEKLWFTGKYKVVDGFWRESASDEGHTRGYFLIHTYDVSTSFMQQRPHDYFLATFLDDWRNLALFYVGQDFAKLKTLNQAHVFEKKAYGTR